MSEHIIQTLMEAVQQQETELKELKALNGNAESLANRLREVSALMTKLQADKQTLSQQITRLNHQLSKPVAHQHYHHVHKLVGIAAGLFLALAVTLAGWYNTGQRLATFRASDTKLRFLRLQHDKTLLQWIYAADSLHLAGSDRLRDGVDMEEAIRRRRGELLEKAARKEADAEDLRKRAKVE